MPWFAYRCPEHGEFESMARGDNRACPVPDCGVGARRLWQWSSPVAFQEHFNPTFGTVLKNRQQAKDHAMRVSDEQSERLGMTINYEVTDALDNAAAGVTDTELAQARERVVKQGEKEAAARRAGVKIDVGGQSVQL